MARAAATHDPYRRRREAGAASREETRRRLLVAADELFREQGYTATTVSAITARAGVSLQTLYLAWGSKRALLRAAAAAAAAAAQSPVSHEEWRATIGVELATAAGEDPSAAAYLAAASRLFVRVAERTAPYWSINQQASATDPEVADDWRVIEAERRRTMEEVAAAVPRRGLRPALGRHDVADTLWALLSPEVYQLLTAGAGRSPAEFGAWLERTLVGALCQDESQGAGRRAAAGPTV